MSENAVVPGKWGEFGVGLVEAWEFDGYGLVLTWKSGGSPAQERPELVLGIEGWRPAGDEAPIMDLPVVKSRDLSRMMDRLWAAGIRPSGGMQREGMAEALAAEVKDLRSVRDRLLTMLERLGRGSEA